MRGFCQQRVIPLVFWTIFHRSILRNIQAAILSRKFKKICNIHLIDTALIMSIRFVQFFFRLTIVRLNNWNKYILKTLIQFFQLVNVSYNNNNKAAKINNNFYYKMTHKWFYLINSYAFLSNGFQRDLLRPNIPFCDLDNLKYWT